MIAKYILSPTSLVMGYGYLRGGILICHMQCSGWLVKKNITIKLWKPTLGIW